MGRGDAIAVLSAVRGRASPVRHRAAAAPAGPRAARARGAAAGGKPAGGGAAMAGARVRARLDAVQCMLCVL